LETKLPGKSPPAVSVTTLAPFFFETEKFLPIISVIAQLTEYLDLEPGKRQLDLEPGNT
jgi:hypothetical protein